MPSPFPGMDPFIESHAWQGLRTRFINVISDALVELLRLRYVVEGETYIFLEADESLETRNELDVAVTLTGEASPVAPSDRSAALLAQPITLTLPSTFSRRKQHFVRIRTRDHRQVIAIIELLLPTNKRAGVGHAEYQLKRENILASDVKLAEIDLLRDGVRLPSQEPLPTPDYFAFVLRAASLPKFEAFAWSLRDPLPTIGIPLRSGDSDISLTLQDALDVVYDRAGYRHALDYSAEIQPALSAGDQSWAATLLEQRKPT